MDDLSALISQVLNDPEKLKQLQSVASSLGINANSDNSANTAPPPSAQQPSQAPDLSGLLNLLRANEDSGGNNSNNSSPDLSAIANLLGSAGGGGNNNNNNSNTPDLSYLLNLLRENGDSGGGNNSGASNNNNNNSSPDLSAITNLLGNAGGGGNNNSNNSSPDLSAIANLLGGAKSGGGMPDLSSLSNILSSFTQGATQSSDNAGNGFDVSSLTSMLKSGNPEPQEQQQGGGGIDINTILKLQQAMANVQANKSSIDMLLALKPRLSERRSKKVDDAIRIMQVIQFLPLIKESGLFGQMDSFLGGMGGGFGNIINNITTGLRR